jgi:hypothetical protein
MDRALQAMILHREHRSRARENPMPRRALGPNEWMMSGAVCAVLAVVAVSIDSPAQAECITQPNQQVPEGAHWSLHTDHAKNRRCWVLVDAAGHDLSTPPQEEQSAASSALSTLQTFIGNITGTGGGPSSPPAQEAPAAVPQAPAGPPLHRNPPRAVNANRPEPAVRTEQKDKGDAHAGRHEISDPDREALFEEFLRWHESQQILGPGNPPR